MLLSKKLMGAPVSGEAPATVAYVLAQDVLSLTSVSISNPSGLSVLHSVPSSNFSVTDEVVVNKTTDVAYVVTAQAYCVPVNISDPSNMVVGSTFTRSAWAAIRQMVINNSTDFAYCACIDYVGIINVSNPTSLSYAEQYLIGTSKNLNSIVIDEAAAMVYVLNATDNTIHALSTTNPTSLSEVGTYTNTTHFTSPGANLNMVIDTDASVLYVVNGTTDSILSIDISNPAAMGLLDTYTNTTYVNTGSGVALDANTKTLFVSAGVPDRFSAFSVSNPSAISLLSSLQSATNFDLVERLAIDPVNKVAFITNGNRNGVVSVDIGNPSSMVFLQRIVDNTNLDKTVDIALG